jgi:hypothetical protein
MSKTVSFEVPDDVYVVLQDVATRMGRPTEEVVLEWLARTAPKPRPKLTPQEIDSARKRLQRYRGTVHSGNAHSADNEQIDIDLAREYGNTHEERS